MDTIAAVATPLGEGGISIIRVSGEKAIDIVDSMYRGKKTLSNVYTHTINYGKIVDPKIRQVIDEVLVTVMRAPKTFTREDVIEINCHGGIMVVQNILECLLSLGARLADPGEFTKRAFLNGRIDLSQAEGVIDLIRAKTDKAARLAINQSEGLLSKIVNKLRQEIIETLAYLAVNVDYPEYDGDELTQKFIYDKSIYIRDKITEILNTARQGKIYREGIVTAIVGRPNVGKSSLLNMLAQDNKAIVTDIPGTTRDIVEEYVNISGVPLKLIDTAGIRDTEDIVERLGVKKAQAELKKSDIIFLVLNANEELQEGDRDLLELTSRYTTIIILNKSDLPQKVDKVEVERLSRGKTIVNMSALNAEGLRLLINAVKSLLNLGEIDFDSNPVVSNTRHISLLERSKSAVIEVIEGIESGMPLDMVEVDMKNAWQLLGEVVGDAVSDDLLDQIFSQFCLGK